MSSMPAPVERFVQKLNAAGQSHRLRASEFPRASDEAERALGAASKDEDFAADIQRRFDEIAEWRAAYLPSADHQGRAR